MSLHCRNASSGLLTLHGHGGVRLPPTVDVRHLLGRRRKHRTQCVSGAGRGLVANFPYTGGGGVPEANKICVYLNRRPILGPLITFIFVLRKNFLMWVGGWVRRSPGCHSAPPAPWPARR